MTHAMGIDPLKRLTVTIESIDNIANLRYFDLHWFHGVGKNRRRWSRLCNRPRRLGDWLSTPYRQGCESTRDQNCVGEN